MDLLFLAHRAPFAPDRGDRIRGYHLLRYLAPRARVHLVAFGDPGDDPTPPAELAGLASCTVVPRRRSRATALAVALANGRPVSLAAFADRRLAAAAARIRAAHPIAATYVFSGQMAQYLVPGERAVMDFVDVDSAKFAGYAAAARFPLRSLYVREAHLLGNFERQVAARVDASLFVSETEAQLFRAGGAEGRVLAVGNGIDTSFYNPATAPVATTGPVIAFTGQMDYPPNIAAVRWFADAVLPAVRARHSRVTFAIIGRAPTASVRALAARDGVIVTGEVADVRGWLAAAAVVVAPLQLARGIQNKVLEAMAMARPVVATAAAAEGIDHRGTLAVADDAAAFAQRVVDLLDDPAAAAAQGREARARVVAGYGWDAQLAALDPLLGLSARRAAA